jgi:hypothetical protein
MRAIRVTLPDVLMTVCAVMSTFVAVMLVTMVVSKNNALFDLDASDDDVGIGEKMMFQNVQLGCPISHHRKVSASR